MVLHGQRGRWELPGGNLEPGVGARAGAMRELREESGQEVDALELRAMARLRRRNGREHDALVFACELPALAPFRRNGETASVMCWRGETAADVDPAAGIIARYVLSERGGRTALREGRPGPRTT